MYSIFFFNQHYQIDISFEQSCCIYNTHLFSLTNSFVYFYNRYDVKKFVYISSVGKK